MTPDIYILDTKFLDETSVIASYLLESDDGLVLVETGPETVFINLKEAIAEKGYNWQDVNHVLLTHIHFDHAGAAWKFAQNGAKVYVHPVGLPHLNHPMRLWNSARRIYGDDMERLWGEMKPIAEELLVPAEDGTQLDIGGLPFKVHYTPGHAIHHNAYQLGGVIFTGDVAGVRINNGPVVPPCPPPDINIEAWKKSIAKLRNLNPDRLYIAHFGRVVRPMQHLDDLEKTLDDWAGWMKPYYDDEVPAEDITPKFEAYTQGQLKEAGVSEENCVRYEKGNPSFMSVTGLLRYWELKGEGRI